MSLVSPGECMTKNRQSGRSEETTAIKLEFKVVPNGRKENVQREAQHARERVNLRQERNCLKSMTR